MKSSPPLPNSNTLVAVDPLAPDAGVIQAAAAVLRAGGVVALPTETVYGLAVNALDPDALDKLFRLKERPRDKPVLVLIGDRTQLGAVAAAVSPRAERLIERFWPGPLTLLLPAAPDLPELLMGEGRKVGVRVPSHPVALRLARAVPFPITGTSANPSGTGSLRTAGEVAARLAPAGGPDLILDAGELPPSLESTVVDVTGSGLTVVRAGAVSTETLLRLG